LRDLCALGEVAGNHGRFLFDFSPESIVLRVSADPAPRILYGFGLRSNLVHIDDVVRKVRSGDITANELVIGGAIVDTLGEDARSGLAGVCLLPGVKAACDAVCEQIGD
jgi:CRISPR-associated protein Cst2